MEIKVIELAAVDADEMNPRDDFGDIDALAESFENGIWPGEPVQPIVVVADGARWRIVDGERRYRAMRSLGRESCHAVCCEGLDEANCVVAMLATDDKKELSEVERSRGVQQALLLGVAPETVEKAGRFFGAAAVKRAMKRVGDANKAAQMPLAQLVAIDAAEGAGDAEGADEIAEAGAGWRDAARKVEVRRERAEAIAAWTEKCKAAGVNLAVDGDDVPKGYTWTRRLTLDDDLSELPDAAVVRFGGAGVVYLYLPAEDGAEEETDEERALRERVELFEVQAANLDAALWEWAVRRAWLAGYASDRAPVVRMWIELKRPAEKVFEHISQASESLAAEAEEAAPTYSPDACGMVWLAVFADLTTRMPSYLCNNLAHARKVSDWDAKLLFGLVRLAAITGVRAFAQKDGFGDLLAAMEALAAPTDAGDGGGK